MTYAEGSISAPANPFMGNVAEQKFKATVTGKWHITVHNDHTELETVWRKLESEGHCTAFQTYDWTSCWYDAAMSCGEAEPVIIVVQNEEAELVWILPLCRYRKKGMRIISFADLGITDYTAPLIARGAPADQKSIKTIIDAVLDALPSCDLINFQKLIDKVEGVPNPLLSLKGLEHFPVGRHGIRLCEPWPSLAEKIMQRRLRSTIRRQRNNIEKHGDVAFVKHNLPETIAPVLDELLTMRRARFEAMGRPDLSPVWKNFYYALSARKNRTLDLSVTTMTVSGEAIASCFGLVRGKNYHALLPTFKIGKWEKFRPGAILFDTMLTGFSEQTQADGYFDFTVGDEIYKKRFGSESHPLYEWMAPRSVAGLVICIAWRAKVIIRRHPRILAALKKVADKARGLKAAEVKDPFEY